MTISVPSQKILSTCDFGSDGVGDQNLVMNVASAPLVVSSAVSKDSAKLAAVKKFLAFMMEPENQAAYATATSQVPATPNDVYKPSDVAATYIVDAIAGGKTAPLTNQLWPNPTIVPEQRKLTQMMLGGDASPKDITDAMDKAWDTGA